ncbi:hypothetical protein [Sabulicella glaciei]|uniref:DUF3311 domain-containing protein n=1 Tax=Sabulicella glaciei TaxID=2984948 RepID=A0ABT3NU90_9PROT|nr:hypothetical protein [Roseococcus sp. MDT2-1-1]MCW8085721.1 hypothetical protein [Roseococcus sp. MDT2-1-1]
MSRQGGGHDRLVALCLLAVVLFSPWLLRIFGGSAGSGAIWPPLYLYLFVAWAAVILLLALHTERRGRRRRREAQAPDARDAT